MSVDLEKYTVEVLKQLAKKKGISGYSKLRKAELIKLIIGGGSDIGAGSDIGGGGIGGINIGSGKCEFKFCPDDKICNPTSGLCVKRDGKIGKKLSEDKINDISSGWVIFSIDGCSACKNAKDFFVSSNITYKEHKVIDSTKFKSYIGKYVNGYNCFPMIFNDGKFIGGYTDLKDLYKSKPLEPKPLEPLEPKPLIPSDIHMMDPIVAVKTTFKGTPWYDLICMLYLLYKHPKECIAIPDGLKTSEGKLTDKGFSVRSFSDTSIEWDEKSQDFVIPKGLWKAIRDCIKSDSRFVVIPIGFACINKAGHANMLIYDTKTKEIERFEPNGYIINNKCLVVKDFDQKIMELLNKNVDKDMVKVFHEPLSFCPYKNFQMLQHLEGETRPTDPPGFCAAWSTWYADTRLSNPNKTRKQVVEMSLKYLRERPESFTSFIRSYSAFLVLTAAEIRKSNNPMATFTKFAQKYR